MLHSASPTPARRLAVLTRHMSSSASRLSVVHTANAPAAIGPYSQAIKTPTGLLFVSGQIAADASTGVVIAGGVKEQTRHSLANLKAILTEAGASLEDVAKTTVFLKNMNDFADMNEVYAEVFGAWKPARAAVEVARLPKDVLVEIDCVAVVKQ